MSRVFTNGPGDRSSILGRVIPKTQKMLLDAALLNTQENVAYEFVFASPAVPSMSCSS